MAKGIFTSRKFWAAIVSIVVLGIGEYFKIDKAFINSILTVAVAYIVGTGISDISFPTSKN